MSNAFEDHPGLRVSEARANQRRKQLEPTLINLADTAAVAYGLLLPHAKPESEAGQDFPLRRQEFELGNKVVGGFVKLTLDPKRKLTLYHNHTSRVLSYAWQFRRLKMVAERRSESTKITKFIEPRLHHDGGVMDIKVDTYLHEGEAGDDLIHDDYLCSNLDNYRSAEDYIEAFEADMHEAVERFVS